MVLQEPTRDTARLQSSGAKITVPKADRGIGVDLVDQGLQPIGKLPFPAQRPAYLAGPVASEERFARGAEKLDVLGLGGFGRAGRTAENPGGFDPAHENPFKAPVPVGEGAVHPVGWRKDGRIGLVAGQLGPLAGVFGRIAYGFHAPNIYGCETGGNRKMNIVF